MRASPPARLAAAVAVLGAGSWGTALAVHLARVGHQVALWARREQFAASLASAGENSVYLPGVRFPASLMPTTALKTACARADMLLFVCPSSAVRPLAEEVQALVGGTPLIVSAAKGVEGKTRLTMSAVLRQVLAGHQSRVAVRA